MKRVLPIFLIVVLYSAVTLSQNIERVVVLFEHDSDNLRESFKEEILNTIEDSKPNEVSRVSIAGHTDGDGTKDYNLKLSNRRVIAVQSFLLANGIGRRVIDASHFGEQSPISSNKNDSAL